MLKVLGIITERGKAERICGAIKQVGAQYEHVFLATGTARSDVLTVLGLGTSEREVILCTVMDENLDAVYKVLREDFDFEKHGTGIAFTIPVTAVGGPASLYILSGGQAK